MDEKSRVVEAFKEKYRREPDGVIFTPYRVCPLGAHSDHNLGKITGFAIDKGVYMAYAAKMNGVVELSSLQFDKRAQWHVAEVPTEKENDWADHFRGATIALSKRFPMRKGMSAVVSGELPIGGLSSSAAVIIAVVPAACRFTRDDLHLQRSGERICRRRLWQTRPILRDL